MKPKKTLDPEKTRADILAAATRCFSKHGFAGTSIGDIAEEADVTKSLVQYHFGSKKGLWEAVAKSHVGPFLARIDRILDGSGPVDPKDLLDVRFEMLSSDPELVRILSWIHLDGGSIPQEARDKAPQIRAKFAERGLGDRFLVAVAAMDGWFQGRVLYHALFGDIDDRAFYDAILEVTLGEKR
jgi:AcrR family transcriptional regulator